MCITAVPEFDAGSSKNLTNLLQIQLRTPATFWPDFGSVLDVQKFHFVVTYCWFIFQSTMQNLPWKLTIRSAEPN